MSARNAAVALAILIGILIVPATATTQDGPSLSGPGQVENARAPKAKGIWVGFVVARYHRFYSRSSGTTEANDGRVSITVRGDGKQTAVAAKTEINDYPNLVCKTRYEANGVYTGKPLQPIGVSLFEDHYRINYPNQQLEMTVNQESGCEVQPPTAVTASALDYYVVIEGPARRRLTRVNGGFTKDISSCGPEVYCEETLQAAWDLHFVRPDEDGGAAGGSGGGGAGGSGGGGTGGGGGGGAGEGCEDIVKGGTELDDELVGSNRDELLLALGGVDLVRAGGGHDCAWGGPGADVLEGAAGNDLVVGDEGADSLNGGRGNDELRARDGEIDQVICKAGVDSAIVDREDEVSGCETLRYR